MKSAKYIFVYFNLITIAFFSACNSGDESSTSKIDRYALVNRHNVKLNKPDSLNSLTVGNGEFAYTVDISGMQSFPEYYQNGVSLGTQSQWGWHVIPTDQNYKLEEVYQYDTSCTGQVIPFPVRHDEGRKRAASDWLRSNPHRLHLGIVGLVLLKENGEKAAIYELENVEQELNLWTGGIVSNYAIEGVPVKVELYAHQEKDQIAAKITSPLLEQGRLKVFLKFPYGSECHVCPGYDWGNENKHSSTIQSSDSTHILLKRQLDKTVYYTSLQSTNASKLSQKDKHHFVWVPTAKSNVFEFSVLFSKSVQDAGIPDFESTKNNSEEQWKSFWTNGGAVDFSGSTDPRANELERRVVLSQYLTKVNCAGSMPPQETGLTMNSWYGKFHLEMHWWHGVHFALWNRIGLLEKSLPWYFKVAERAKQTAKLQGFDGLRWQKMTGPNGNESPSGVAPYLIWQQPHFLYFAELLYRQDSSQAVLNKYKKLVFETADFMASFAQYNPDDGQYHLCAPVKPAQELFPSDETLDPPFELSYWDFGLSVAQKWRERLGMEPNKKWQEVLDKLAPLPQADGLYFPTASHPDAYSNKFYRRDHPVVLGSYGMLPLTDRIDTAIMRNTLNEILSGWQWDTTWGWDYPMIAMNAARLGLPEKAVDALLMDVQKNTYLKNGHNYQDKRLRIYLPGNGALLTAVAMMAAGWDGAPDKTTPGFPDNGKWMVKWEGLQAMP